MLARSRSLALLGALAASSLWGQSKPDLNPRRGLQPTGSYMISDIESLSLTSGNLMLSIPLVSLPPNRVGDAPVLSLVYNSKIWEPETVDVFVDEQWIQDLGVERAGDGGWRYAVGYQLELKTRPLPSAEDCKGGYDFYNNYKLRVVFPDGSKHLLRVLAEVDPYHDGYYPFGPDGRRSQYCHEETYSGEPTRVYYTTDGTFARLEVQQDFGTPDTNHLNNPWTLYLKDGTRVYGGNAPEGGHRPQSICDRNANCVSVEYSSGDDLSFVSSITDEHDRQITITNGGPYHVITSDVITATGYGEAALSWTVDWASGTNDFEQYRCGNTLCGLRPYQGWNVTEIHLPAATGLLPYSFQYNARFGELSEVRLPSGATVNYTYKLDAEQMPQWDRLLANYPNRKVVSYTDEFTGGAAPSETSTLELTQNLAGKYESSTFTGPDGGTTVTHFVPYDYQGPGTWDSGLITQIDHPDGSVTWKGWLQNVLPVAFFYDNRNAYVSQETFTPFGGSPSARNYVQDRNGNTTFVSEYDWASPGGLLRSTTTTFFLGTSGDPGGTNADGYWNTGVGCTASSCILNLPKSTSAPYPDTAREEFCYDAAGNLTLHARLKQGGSATPLANCSTGTLTSAAIGSRYTYGTHGNLLTAIDPRGGQTRYEYAAENLYVTDKYEADGTAVERHWHFTTDLPSGKVKTVTDVDNSVETITDYDAFGRPITVTDPAKTTTIAYNDAARYKCTTTAGNGPTLDEVEHYDQLGRVVLTRRSENGQFGSVGSVQANYNQTGNGIKVERRFENLTSGRYEYISNPYRGRSGDATRGVTRRQYDSAGRLIEEATFSGSYPVSEQNRTGTSTISYTGPSHTATDPAGKARTLTADALGRLVNVVEASYPTSYTYSAQNNLTGVTQGTQTRTFVYDPLGRLTSANNPESGLTSYTYDDNGNLLTKTDALGVVTNYSPSGYAIDALNRVRKKTFSDGTPAVTYTYDADLAIPNPDGQHSEVAMANKPKGRLVRVENSEAAAVYRYDAAGRAQSSLMTIGGQNYVFGYTHKWAGLESMRYPSGRQVSNGFDASGQVTSVAGYASGIQYAPHGAVSSLSLQNGVVQTTAYNSRLQPTSIAAGSLLTLGFGYGTTNNNGNVMSQTISAPGASATQNYSYDNLNRLSGASEGSTWSRTFGYDAYGNMWVDTNSGVAADSFTPRLGSWFNSSNRMVNGGLGIQYRDSGELQQIGGYTFTYDAESRLKTSTLNGVTTTYSYDGEGRRVMKAVAGGATTTYVYDAMGKLAAEYGGTVETGGRQYLTSDHLGSTRLVTNASGGMVKRYDYLPFGEEIPAGVGFRTTVLGYAADGFPLKFTGKERDAESGLDYFGARYFSGAQGRFTTVDPSMQSAVLRNPQSWNRYSYTLNNPLRYIDPNGELWIASGDSGRPYSWVDECENGKVCYTSVAAALKGVVRVYGSQNAKDIKDYTPNENGMIDLAYMASNDDSRFSIPGGTKNPDRFTTAEAAAAWFSATAQQDASIIITSASLASGKGDPVHPKSHGLPNAAIDFLYSDSSGRALWGPGSASQADAQRMQALFGLITAWGFNQTVSGRPADFGTGPKDVTSQNGRDLVQQHQNHGHVGIVERLRPPRR